MKFKLLIKAKLRQMKKFLALSLFDGVCLFVCFVALRPKSTAMVIAGRSIHSYIVYLSC